MKTYRAYVVDATGHHLLGEVVAESYDGAFAIACLTYRRSVTYVCLS